MSASTLHSLHCLPYPLRHKMMATRGRSPLCIPSVCSLYLHHLAGAPNGTPCSTLHSLRCLLYLVVPAIDRARLT